MQIQCQFHFAVAWILTKLSQNFAHVTKAVLLWHVQKFVAIWWPVCFCNWLTANRNFHCNGFYPSVSDLYDLTRMRGYCLTNGCQVTCPHWETSCHILKWPQCLYCPTKVIKCLLCWKYDLYHYVDGLMQDCSISSKLPACTSIYTGRVCISSALAMEILQSCTKLSMWIMCED